jgi:hypothetical protein
LELIRAEDMPNSFTVADLSDFHLGSPNCAEETLIETIEKIRSTKDRYAIFKGDAIEAILPNDKRYLHSAVCDNLKSPIEQAKRVVEIMTPIADRILAWGIGNHELKLWNTMDFGKHIADSLCVPYGAYNFKIAFRGTDGKLMFKSYHTHGMGGLHSNAKDDIQYEANRKAQLKHKLVKSGHADCIYMSRGHDHQLVVVDPTVQNKLFLTDDGEGIHQEYSTPSVQNATFIPPDSRWYATTGSFRKLYSKPGLQTIDYGEVVGYAPSEIGYALITVEDRQIVSVEKVVC